MLLLREVVSSSTLLFTTPVGGVTSPQAMQSGRRTGIPGQPQFSPQANPSLLAILAGQSGVDRQLTTCDLRKTDIWQIMLKPNTARAGGTGAAVRQRNLPRAHYSPGKPRVSRDIHSLVSSEIAGKLSRVPDRERKREEGRCTLHYWRVINLTPMRPR